MISMKTEASLQRRRLRSARRHACRSCRDLRDVTAGPDGERSRPASARTPSRTTLRLCVDSPGCARSTSGALAPEADEAPRHSRFCHARELGSARAELRIELAAAVARMSPMTALARLAASARYRASLVARMDAAQDSDEAEARRTRRSGWRPSASSRRAAALRGERARRRPMRARGHLSRPSRRRGIMQPSAPGRDRTA